MSTGYSDATNSGSMRLATVDSGSAEHERREGEGDKKKVVGSGVVKRAQQRCAGIGKLFALQTEIAIRACALVGDNLATEKNRPPIYTPDFRTHRDLRVVLFRIAS